MLTRVHHVGLVVRRLEDGLAFWRDTLGLAISKQATVEDQGVRAALLPIGRSEIELLEPIDANGGVAKFLERRGEGLHHVCFETPDVARELAAARTQGLPLIDEVPRQGLAGTICFLHPKGTRGVLVEFATPPPGEAPHASRGAGPLAGLALREVTVRSRGVMEKCTYCVQRIRQAEIEAKRQDRPADPDRPKVVPIYDGEVLTACQEACPAGAIVFGDVNGRTPKGGPSEVARLKEGPLNYALLGELNTRPRTTYLAALRNPNPDIGTR